ncbi:MAG: apolipoprotein N-acyltransferase [Candidatus Methylomirabilales bacterium]
MALKQDTFAALPGAARLVLAAAGGLLTAAAFPPLDWGLLAFVGLAPLFLALPGASRRAAGGLGYAYGLAFFLATIPWVITTMTVYGKLPFVLSVLVLLLLAGVLALYPAAFAVLLREGEARLPLPGWLLPVVAALLWVGLEVARTFLLSGFPWALLGYTQYRQPTVRLLAAALGVYGISGLVVLVNAALARLLLTLPSGRRPEGLAAAGLAVVALLGTGAYAHGLWRDPTGGEPQTVALLQGNIDQSIKWDEGFQARTLEIYERLARRAAAERPALIVWPETAVPFFLRYEPVLGERVLRLARELGIPMLVGSPDASADRLYNSAFLVMPDGRIAERYDKRHLVPFGEYVPLQSLLFFVEKMVVGIGDFGRGREATVFPLDGLSFGTMICYEVIFPGEVREFARAGARLLVNITNDAWFGRSGAPAQHLAMAALRAVENGSYLVRAANTGISAVIAPTGAIQAATELFREAAITGRVRPRQTETFYTRTGGIQSAAAAAFLILYSAILLAAALRRAGPGREA